MNALALILLISSLLFCFVPNETKITRNDFQILTGEQWSGTLTYLDYRANKKVSIRANLSVTQSVDDDHSWVFDYQYPDEPKANSKEIIKLSKDGKSINGEAVIERTKLPNGTVRFATEKKGQDNDRSASFRYIYTLSAKMFSIKKEVRYDGETQFFERNEYRWTR